MPQGKRDNCLSRVPNAVVLANIPDEALRTQVWDPAKGTFLPGAHRTACSMQIIDGHPRLWIITHVRLVREVSSFVVYLTAIS